MFKTEAFPWILTEAAASPGREKQGNWSSPKHHKRLGATS